MPDISHEPPEPRNLRFLRWLVIVLTATMIIGIAVLVTLVVLRFPATRPAAPAPAPASFPAVALPEGFRLPEGAEIEAVTRARDWFAIVTRDGEILVYDAGTGELRQRLRPEHDQ